MYLKSITLVFENLETFQIPKEQIEHFYLDDVKTSMTFHQASHSSSIATSLTAEHMVLEVSPEANRTSFVNEHLDEPFNIVDRLSTNGDVSFVELQYDSGMKKHIFVKWDSAKSIAHNYNQSVAFNDANNFVLVVSEKLRAITYLKQALPTVGVRK